MDEVRAALSVLYWYFFLLMFGWMILGAPAGGDPRIINHIMLIILLVVILGPFFATPFAVVLRLGFFGPEGLLAASTVWIRPSQVPAWDSSKSCQVKYPPNKRIRGYRHCFFYSDEHVIEDISNWIRQNGHPGCPVSAGVAKPRTAVQTLIAQWTIPVAASIAMVASFTWPTVSEIINLSRSTSDFATGTNPIRDHSVPVLDINQTIKEAWYPTIPATPGSLTPYTYSAFPPKMGVGEFDIALSVSPAAVCVIEGEATLSDWNMYLTIYLYEPRPPPEAAEKEVPQMIIWNWRAKDGKEVRFRRRFRNYLPPGKTKFLLRVTNESTSPHPVMVKMYGQCSADPTT
jgi:hypothetical protein